MQHPDTALRRSIEDRQQGLGGSAIAYLGPSRTGKSKEASAMGIASALLVDGLVWFYDPTGDLDGYVTSYKLGAVQGIDRGGSRRAYNVRLLEFLRGHVQVYTGRDAHDLFDDVEDVIGDGRGHSRPFGCVVIDESAVARAESGFLESIVPRGGNGGILFVFTAHRWMALPPQARGITRFRALWRGADSTGDSELERLCDRVDGLSEATRERLRRILDESGDSDAELRAMADRKGFQFSPVMSGVEPSEQWFRGIYYGATGPEFREYNPNIARRPDWTLLPALVSRPRPMELV